MEPESSSLIMRVTHEELEDCNVQVTAYAFNCEQHDSTGKISIVTHKPGTVKIFKLPDGKRCIAMYGVMDYRIFGGCLAKIATIKNLKSVAFSETTFKNEKHMELLEIFAEDVNAIVYLYSEKEKSEVHRSFGDLLGQIRKWKNENAGWDRFFHARLKDKTISTLNKFLQEEAKEYYVYPAPNEIFNAMILTQLSSIKVLIVGQDPYHTTGAAMGLAFSHKDDYGKLQPSLKNIYTELENCGYKVNKKSGNLTKWATQGVFLINTALTVRQGQANSHSNQWKLFIEHLFKFLNKELAHAVVILWGGHAQSYGKYFDTAKFKILASAHPSPLSAHQGFLGCKHFLKCNNQLKIWGMRAIDWNLA